MFKKGRINKELKDAIAVGDEILKSVTGASAKLSGSSLPTTTTTTSAPCYAKGDIGPGGGIIFALPYVHPNTTKFYFEAAPEDIALSGMPIIPDISSDCNISGQSILGAEFGQVGVPFYTSLDIGDGKKNTDIIHALPLLPGTPSGGIHPYLNTHDIAATLCVNYSSITGKEDWFLPSMMEAWMMMQTIGPPTSQSYALGNIGNFQTMFGLPADEYGKLVYWTSSTAPAASDPGIKRLAVTNFSPFGVPMLLPRCQTYSVRPIRMFEKCPEVSDPPDPPSDDCGILGASGIGTSTAPVVYYPDLASTGGPGIVIFDVAATPIQGIQISRMIEVARYHDKIWMYIRYENPNLLHGILELDFNVSIPSASFNRLIPLQNQALLGGNTLLYDWLGGGTGIDSTTVVFSRLCTSCPAAPYQPLKTDLIKFDVSGSTAVETILFPTVSNANDMLYLSSSDTYVTVECCPYAVYHYTATGTLLGSVNLPPTYGTVGIFCYNGDIMLPLSSSSLGLSIWVLDLASMTMSISTYPGNLNLYSDSATNPECCYHQLSDPVDSFITSLKKIGFTKRRCCG